AEPVANANFALTQLYENLSANESWRHSFTTPVSLTLTNYLLSPRAMGIINPAEAAKIPTQTNGEILISGFPFFAPSTMRTAIFSWADFFRTRRAPSRCRRNCSRNSPRQI